MTKYEYSRPPVLAQDLFPFAAELNPRRPQRNQGAAGGLKGLAKWKGQPATLSQMDEAISCEACKS